MLPAFAPRVAFVDLETTGARPLIDRIIEVGIVTVEETGEVAEWSRLVQPGGPVPSAVTRCTGIDDAMLRDAAPFSVLADDVAAQLEGCLFVAHNARFDYQFLRQEFRRLGRDFRAPVLCTVRLSRALYPTEHRHGLDALIERHGLRCESRHRALADARVLWDFVRGVASSRDPGEMRACVERAMRAPSLPPGLDAEVVDAIPDVPGVYTLYGAAGEVLFVDAAARLRAQVSSQLSGGKGRRWVQAVCGVSWTEAPGELGAHLRAADVIGRERPRHGHRLPKPGATSPHWPFPGVIAVCEIAWDGSRSEVHAFDRWRHLGSARDEAELQDVLRCPLPAAYDPRLARLLQRLLAQPSFAARVRRLGSLSPDVSNVWEILGE